MAFYEFSLAPDYDNADELENIEDITPPNTRSFVVPDAFATFNSGRLHIRFDGMLTTTGFMSAAWAFIGMPRLGYHYLRDTYCNGGLSGRVTLRTLDDTGTWKNYNAIMHVPPIHTLRRILDSFDGVDIRFTRLKEIVA